jgi:RPA family protein
MAEARKRETAHKLRIGDLLRANQVFEQTESLNRKLQFVELGNRKIIRVNIISNVVDKFENDSAERRFASITLDDGSGQIRARLFGEEISKFKEISQGDTLTIIGVLRSFNEELYILPEIIRKTDPKYLLIRKLEIEKLASKHPTPEQKKQIKALRDEVTELIKNAEKREGIDKDEIIMTLKEIQPNLITQEIQRLLEEGIIYEPRPGRVRYLG